MDFKVLGRIWNVETIAVGHSRVPGDPRRRGGSGSTFSSTRTCSASSAAWPRWARTTWCSRSAPAWGPSRPTSRTAPSGRARSLARAAPPRGPRRPRQRRAPLRRRLTDRSRGARPGPYQARLEPALQHRDAARGREPRWAAEPRALVRDGATRGRRPLLRAAFDEGVRRRLGARPAGRRPHRVPRGLP